MRENEILFVIGLGAAMFAFSLAVIVFSWLAAKVLNAMPQMHQHSQPVVLPNLRPAFTRLSERYGGRLLPGPMYELPRLTFSHNGATVLVETKYTAQLQVPRPGFAISVRLAWPDATMRMELYPDGLLAQLRKLIGMRDIEVGDVSFDRKFMISGNKEEVVRRFLSPPVRELVTAIRGPRYDGDIHLHIVGGQLSISKRNMTGDEAELLKLIEQSLALFDAALCGDAMLDIAWGDTAAGIQFLGSAIGELQAPTCQVCGESVDSPEVRCQDCQTPHHRECWDYFGGCSTYGCRGKRFETYAQAAAK